jgi:hypothetical protein
MQKKKEVKEFKPLPQSVSPCGVFTYKPMKTGLRITYGINGETVKLTYTQWDAIHSAVNASGESYLKLKKVKDVHFWHLHGYEYKRGVAGDHHLQANVLHLYYSTKTGPRVAASMPSLFISPFNLPVTSRYRGYGNFPTDLVKVECALNKAGMAMLKALPKPPASEDWPSKGPRKPGTKIRLTPAQQSRLDDWPSSDKTGSWGYPEGTKFSDGPVWDNWEKQSNGNCTMDCLQREGLVERGLIGVHTDKQGNIKLDEWPYPSVAYRLTIKGALLKSE